MSKNPHRDRRVLLFFRSFTNEDKRIDLVYNPSPHQSRADMARCHGIQFKEKLIFENGNTEEICNVCNKRNMQSKSFGMCPQCHYERFYMTVEERALEQLSRRINDI